MGRRFRPPTLMLRNNATTVVMAERAARAEGGR
jgi:hypothetical protein